MATITELKCEVATANHPPPPSPVLGSDIPNDDLHAVRETLESRGVLGQLKARIRAEVFSALDDQRESRPPLSHENLLINELIREYLEFNKYRYTASVLSAESGQPKLPLDRQFLANELKVAEDTSSKSVPLLYGLVSHFMNSSDNGGRVFLGGTSLPVGPTASSTSPGPDT